MLEMPPRTNSFHKPHTGIREARQSMGGPTRERTLREEDLQAMVQVVDPTWELLDATFMRDGETAIYRLDVNRPAECRTVFLKATPLVDTGELRPRVDTEARVTATVGTQTDIPVPRILGAVDTHDQLRTPYFLMDAMPGRVNDMEVLFDLGVEQFSALARETGRYLGELHELSTPNLTRYGQGFTHAAEQPQRGGQPTADPTQFTFPDGHDAWKPQLRAWIDDDLDTLRATGQFDALADHIAATLDDLVARLPAVEDPVIGRVDHGFWNFLTDPAVTRSTGWIDWGSLFAVPPAFDLAVTEYYLAGGPWMVLDEIAGSQASLRDALESGYEEVRELPDAYELQRRCYRLDTAMLTLASFGRDRRKPRHLPESRVDEAAAGVRRHIETLL